MTHQTRSVYPCPSCVKIKSKRKIGEEPNCKVVPRRSPEIQDLLFKHTSVAHKIDPGGVSKRCKPPVLTQKGIVALAYNYNYNAL